MGILKNKMPKDYYLWFTGGTVFSLGSSIEQTAVPLVAFAVTQSTKTAGVISMAVSIGCLIAMIPSGVVADYYDRRKTIMVLGALDAIIAFILAALIYTEKANLIWLVVLGFIAAVIGTVVGVANNALLKNIVSTEQFPTAMSLNEGRSAAVSIIGGPIGGALFALSHALPSAVYSFSALIRVFTTKFIKRSEGTAPRIDNNHIKMLTAGLHIVVKEPFLRSLTIIAALLNFAGGAIFLAVILDLQQRHTPPALIGAIFTAISVGALVGAPLAGFLLHRVPTGKLIVLGFVVEAIGMALLAVSSNVFWVVGCIAVACIALPCINGSVEGFLMASVPSEFQGRVGSAVSFVALAIAPLAPLAAGFLLAGCGREWTILINSFVFVIALALAVGMRAVRSIPLPEKWDEHASSIREHCEALSGNSSAR
ncbi:MFS transporter [Trueperella sp. LYQ141]|uniref:MFS transporter n=1 Tax=Trueperella sp. LYQ141 TaxID=3391058 RepID=UPI0039835090